MGRQGKGAQVGHARTLCEQEIQVPLCRIYSHEVNISAASLVIVECPDGGRVCTSLSTANRSTLV